MKILYVENHARFATIAVSTFLSEYTVTVVPRLAEARLALRDHAFDLILLDQDLDDGKGAELAAELRARGDLLPILAVSAHAAGNAALLQAGADAVCAKPAFAGVQPAIRRLMSSSVQNDG
jgi:two-component system OmpR family response regulator